MALLIALFLPKEFPVEWERSINQPKDTVFNYVKYLKNQDTFSVWSIKDPAMKKTFTGTDGTVGAIADWDSMDENVGVGEQEITKIIEGERIDFEFRFKVPIESTDFTYLSTKAISPNQTKVTWRFNGKMPYPMNFMLPFMNMEQCLEKIYKIAKTTEK
ncbi:SRPBCC family protein [Flavobacterium sp. LB3P45]|uniref:SRPBCC family protein n=1 Tax=Flavobacterium fructosi TaxID=3230416 RepID=A0ABW6HSD5_9FLAO